MDAATYKHLAFLLSLGSVPACFHDIEPDAESASGTNNATSTTTTETATGTTGTTGITGTTLSTESTDTLSSSTGTTGTNAGNCSEFASKVYTCTDGEENAEYIYTHCHSIRNLHQQIDGANCVLAFDAYSACYGAASCEKLGGNNGSCNEELQTYLQACEMPAFNTCLTHQAKVEECETMATSPFLSCLYNIVYGAQSYSEPCGLATEDAYACLSLLSCSDFAANTGCEDEKTAVSTFCK